MKNRANLLWVLGGLVIITVFSLPILSLDFRDYTIDLATKFPYLAPLVVAGFRFIGVVLAPLPGSPIAFASMAVMPWYEAWTFNFLGTELGAITAFLVARRFREPVAAKFISVSRLHQWQEKISQNKQLWAFVGLRFISLVAFDFVSYAAGLTKLSFRNFLIATFIIDIPITFVFFYLGGVALQYSIFLFTGFIILFFAAMAFWARNLKLN